MDRKDSWRTDTDTNTDTPRHSLQTSHTGWSFLVLFVVICAGTLGLCLIASPASYAAQPADPVFPPEAINADSVTTADATNDTVAEDPTNADVTVVEDTISASSLDATLVADATPLISNDNCDDDGCAKKPKPTKTHAPTHTPTKTPTKAPTKTPMPTKTPTPTRIGNPTQTPTPTPTPDPSGTSTPAPTPGFMPFEIYLPVTLQDYPPPPSNHTACSALLVVPPVSVSQPANDPFNIYQFAAASDVYNVVVTDYATTGQLLLYAIVADTCATAGTMTVSFQAQADITSSSFQTSFNTTPGTNYLLAVNTTGPLTNQAYTITIQP